MFRVRWTRWALNHLAAIWISATNKNAITAASHVIDQTLAADPENQGESRPNNRRVLFASPLGVRYRVYPDRRIVRVLVCWQIRQV